MQIVVAGNICVDLLPAIPEAISISPGRITGIGPLAFQPGGCVFNTGTALSALGSDVDIVSTIGDDYLGTLLSDALARRRIDLTHVEVRKDLRTSYSIVIETLDMDRSFWHHAGASSAFTGHEIDATCADLVHLGYPSVLTDLLMQGARPLVELFSRIHDAGATTSMDLCVVDPASPAGELDWKLVMDRLLPNVDVLSPSIDDLTSIAYNGVGSGDSDVVSNARGLVDAGAAIVMISAGERGSFLKSASYERLSAAGRAVRPLSAEWADFESWIPAAPIDKVVTTNGAGDTATAGLLYGIATGMTPQQAGTFAARAASAKIQGKRLESLERSAVSHSHGG